MYGSSISQVNKNRFESDGTLQLSGSATSQLRHWRVDVFSKFEYCYDSFGQYFISSISYCLAPNTFLFLKCTEEEDPQISQHLIALIFFGLPVYFMQLFLGRYTQNSLFNLRFMVPVFRGLIYVVMLRTFISATNIGYYMLDGFLYMCMSFQRTLPWTKCPNVTNTTEFCYENMKPTNCTRDGDCYHASYMYWKYVYMDDAVLDRRPFQFSFPTWHRFVGLVFVWIVVYVVARVAYKRRHRSLATCFGVFFSCMMILLVIMMFSDGSMGYVPNIFVLNAASHVNLKKWAEAYARTIRLIKLGHAHHWLAGARMPMNAPIGLWSIYFMVLLVTLSAILSILYYVTVGVLQYHTNTSANTLPHMHQVFFVTIPGGLSYNYGPQVFTIMFYLGIFIQALGNIIVRIITLQLNLTNWKPALHKYRGYLLVNYCLIIAITGCVFLPEEYYYISRLIFEQVSYYLEVSITVLLIFIVFYIYGVQTLCDDILYLTNEKPIKFWPVLWCIAPLAGLTLLIYTIVIVLTENKDSSFCVSFTLCLQIPILVMVIQQILVFIQRRRLLGLIEPDIEWGVPDPEERHLRRLFNPRTETKYQYNRLKCHHKCIQHSSFLKKVLYCEQLQRRKIMT